MGGQTKVRMEIVPNFSTNYLWLFFQVNLDWKNGWTNESAYGNCSEFLTELPMVVLCADNVANFSSETSVTECVLDIQVSQLGNPIIHSFI